MATLTETFTNIANAIRSKTGKIDKIKGSDLGTNINDIDYRMKFHFNLPQGSKLTILSDYDGLSPLRSYTSHYNYITKSSSIDIYLNNDDINDFNLIKDTNFLIVNNVLLDAEINNCKTFSFIPVPYISDDILNLKSGNIYPYNMEVAPLTNYPNVSQSIGGTTGNYALFAGGYKVDSNLSNIVAYNTVDAYNLSLTKSSAPALNYKLLRGKSVTIKNPNNSSDMKAVITGLPMISGIYVQAGSGSGALNIYNSSLTQTVINCDEIGVEIDGLKIPGDDTAISGISIGQYALFRTFNNIYYYTYKLNYSLTKDYLNNQHQSFRSYFSANFSNYGAFIGYDVGQSGTCMEIYNNNLTSEYMCNVIAKNNLEAVGNDTKLFIRTIDTLKESYIVLNNNLTLSTLFSTNISNSVLNNYRFNEYYGSAAYDRLYNIYPFNEISSSQMFVLNNQMCRNMYIGNGYWSGTPDSGYPYLIQIEDINSNGSIIYRIIEPYAYNSYDIFDVNDISVTGRYETLKYATVGPYALIMNRKDSNYGKLRVYKYIE